MNLIHRLLSVEVLTEKKRITRAIISLESIYLKDFSVSFDTKINRNFKYMHLLSLGFVSFALRKHHF